MIKHYLTIIFRNIVKDKAFTFINLINLTAGFTTFILLSLVVEKELSFGKFNENYDRIYRVQTKQEDSYPINFCTYGPPAYRYHLLEDLPEIEQVLLMREISGQYFTLPDGQQLYDRKGYWCENSIFDIFTINILEGNKSNALTDPMTLALSKSMAEKLFPHGRALGKEVLIGKQHLLTVSAVYDDFPLNSDLRPSFLVSLPTYEQMGVLNDFRNNWVYIDHDNYILLKEGVDPEAVNAKIKDAFKDVKNYEKSSPYLHPLSKHHLSPNSQLDMVIGLTIISFAAILVLSLSCINYINLSLSNSSSRSCEIGIKKVLGFPQKAIAVQFLVETIVFTFFALLLGVLFAHLASPLLNQILINNHDYSIFENSRLIIIILIIGLSAGILSGLYPAFVLSSFNPVKVLKAKLFSPIGNSLNLKKVLVVTQFSISLFMLIVSVILYRHVNFILNKNLGFNSKNILFTEIRASNPIYFEDVRQRLLQHPEILDASLSNTIPYQGNIGGYVSWEDGLPDQKEMISRNYVNYSFVTTYNLKLVQGRNFSPEFPSDSLGCIINETACKAFGWKDAIGKRINLYDTYYHVVGVVKDFHPFSAHNPIPVYIMFLKDNFLSGSSYLTINFTSGQEQKARELATAELETLLPNDPFEFKDFQYNFYLDPAINFWQSMKKLFFFFAVVTLFVSSMGLFGLMLLTIKRRTKEIGIRKVLGSSVGSIYQKLSFEVVGWLVYAVIIACPAAFFIYKTMPGAYKEPLTVLEFVFPIAIVAFVAFLTISYHIIKVAFNDPVEALRYE